MKRNKVVHFFLIIITGIIIIGGSSSLAENRNDIIDALDGEVIHLEQQGESSEFGKINYQWTDEEGNPYEVMDNQMIGARSFKMLSLDSSFDLREEGMVTKTKNQGNTSMCWVFAGMGAIESNLLINGLAESGKIELSKLHPVWFSYTAPKNPLDPLYGDGITFTASKTGDALFQTGGAYEVLTATLARGSGTQEEEAAPFVLGTTGISNFVKMRSYMESREDTRYDSDYLLHNTEELDNASREVIKARLREQGGIDVSYHSVESESNKKKYYHPFEDGVAYFQDIYKNNLDANHSVLIIGWDDNFSKENFNPSCRPKANGAWLVQNSWGSSWGDGGYFWISYEEPTICEFISMQMKESNWCDFIYQYDGFAIWDAIIYTSDTKVANVFKAKGKENLTSVSFYTLTDASPYEIAIYKDVKGSDPSTGTLVAGSITSGVQNYKGYHTVDLKNAVPLEAGEKFAVTVTYKKGSNGYSSIPIELVTGEWESQYSSNKGESFLFNQDQWLDLWNCITSKKYEVKNVPIKAFTVKDKDWVEPVVTPSPSPSIIKNTPSPSGVKATPSPKATQAPAVEKLTLPKNKISLGKGELYQLKVSVIPSSVKTNLTYQSNKPNVVSVSNNGSLKAKQTGKAQIKVSSANKKEVVLNVEIKAAPKKIVLKEKKKTLKVGKTFNVKVKNLEPKNSVSSKITYSSSKKNVATIDSDGKIKAKKKGKTVIMVCAYNKVNTKFALNIIK